MKVRSIFFGSIFLILTSCTSGDYDCEGEIVVENKISDITLELGGEPYRRDVFKNPVVFSHTDNKNISFLAISEDIAIAVAGSKRNNETGSITVLEVTANSTGTTEINIIATDECPDYEKVISFQVTVVDSSSSN